MPNNKTVNIEKNLESLENILQEMESKQLKLEESMTLFEKGLKLIKSCQESLNQTELKIKELKERNK